MYKRILTVFSVLAASANALCGTGEVSPNDFRGTDTQRIQAAIRKAGESSGKIRIPAINTNGTSRWLIDEALLLPGNVTVILDNCTLQLSDSCRDNLFRSANVGIGISAPQWIENIHITGIGRVVLKGAANPRATGDGYRNLVLNPEKEEQNGKRRLSYGSDAARSDRKQTGDWRNILILMAYVRNFSLENVMIENSHAWAVSFERVWHASVSSIRIHNPEHLRIGNRKVKVYNKDGINLRQGCKYFEIRDVTGINGDDLIALSNLDVAPYFHTNGDVNSYQVTSTLWQGPSDDIEQITVTNCQTNYTGVALRASGDAGIHHVYVDGVITKARPDIPPPYGGSPYTLLIGGKGYGKDSGKGKIHNIYATNLIGDGKNLIQVQAPVTSCLFSNALYSGSAPEPITFSIDRTLVENVQYTNLLKVN